MLPAIWPKAAISVAVAVAVAAGVVDWRAARAARRDLQICAAAAGAVAKPLVGCDPMISAAITRSRNATACDVALVRQS